MLIWVLALAAGAAAAIWTYGTRFTPTTVAVAALLRTLAIAGVVALLLDAALGTRRRAAPIVALDVSRSWVRGRDSAAFADALRRARSTSRGTLLLIGDSVREAGGSPAPGDQSSLVRPAVERAMAAGRPLVVVTDGEIRDPDALHAVAEGSSVVVVARGVGPDAALADLRAPHAAVGGDTVDIEVVVIADSLGAPAGSLAVDIGGRPVASVDIDSLPAYAERAVRARVPLPQANGATVLRAVLAARDDVEPRNDTLVAIIEISAAAGAVLVSTAPDYDSRELAAVLRGTLALPTRGFYRVTAQQWREEGTLVGVSADAVRKAAQEAPLLVVHGDTALLGPPRTLAKGALLLVAPPTAPTGEWYATGAPASPMTSALSGSPWDSLPPLDVSEQMPRGAFEILETRRARRLERRVAAVGWETPKRVVVVGASGFWRWRFRSGVGAGVHAAFWGSILDWLAMERSDVRAAVPVDGSVREGQPIRWRRGSSSDTLVVVQLARAGTERSDSLVLRFGEGSLFAESPPLAAGVYDLSVRGGTSRLAVNVSDELLPRRPTVSSGAIGSGVAFADAPRARLIGWVFAIVIALLCAEWVLRRRLGMR